jgi:signal peptidase I
MLLIRWGVLLALLPACRPAGVAPPPSLRPSADVGPTIVEGAPAMARLLAHVDVMALPVSNQLWTAFEQGIASAKAAGASVETIGECGIDKRSAIGIVEVAIAPPFQVIAEAHGTLSVAAVCCVLGMPASDGPISLGAFSLADLPRGGVRFSNVDDAPPGARQPLREPFQRLAARHAGVVLAALGSRAEPAEARWLIDGTQNRFELDFSSQATATAAHAWLTQTFSAAAIAEPAMAGFVTSLEGKTLSVNALVNPDQATATAVAQALRAHVLEAFEMPSGSMEPTLLRGDHFFVGKASPVTVRRGDVISFTATDAHVKYVKRVIGLAGDNIELRDGALSVNGQPVAARALGPTSIDDPAPSATSISATRWLESLEGRSYEIVKMDGSHGANGRWHVVPGRVFVLGDNRDNSFDSRAFGPILETSIIGRVLFVFYSNGRTGIRWERIGTEVH